MLPVAANAHYASSLLTFWRRQSRCVLSIMHLVCSGHVRRLTVDLERSMGYVMRAFDLLPSLSITTSYTIFNLSIQLSSFSI